MEDKNIDSWLQQAHAAGLSDMQIHDQLKAAGWPDEKISQVLTGVYSQQAEDEAIGQIAKEFAPKGTMPQATQQQTQTQQASSQPTATQPAAAQTAPQAAPTAPPSELPGIFDLIPYAWKIFSGRIGTFIAIAVIMLLVGAVIYAGGFFGIIASIGGGLYFFDSPTLSIGAFILPFLIGIIMSVAWSFIFAFSTAAIITAINTNKQSMSTGSVLGTAMKLIIPYWWLSIVLWFFVTGATFLMWVPGLIFGVWFSFALFLPASENVRGFQALLKSKEYVRGRWWPVFGRLLGFYAMVVSALMIINTGLMLIMWFIGFASNSSGTYFVTIILSYLIIGAVGAAFMPFSFCYNYALYQSVRTARAGTVVDTRSTNKKGLLATAIIGWVVIPIVIGTIVFISYMALDGARDKARDATRKSDVSQLRTALVLYYDDYTRYPSTLDDVAGDYIYRIPTDPTTSLGYDYSVSSDGMSFTLCADLESYESYTDSYFCIDNEGNSNWWL